MTFDEIELILGKDVCDNVTAAIERGYVVASSSNDSRSMDALHELVIAQLASLISPKKDRQSAQMCLLILRDAVQSAKGASTSSRH